DEIKALLQEKCDSIIQGFKAKADRLRPVMKVFLNKKIQRVIKKLEFIQRRIHNKIAPEAERQKFRKNLGIAKDPFSLILQHLDPTDLRNVAIATPHLAQPVAKERTRKAKELGFEGNDDKEAVKYLKALYVEVNALYELNLLGIGKQVV